MNKVLVTGGGGFLGKYILKEFVHQGWGVTSIDKHRDSSIEGVDYVVMQLPSADFSRLLQKIKPDLVVHTAGTASVQNSMIDPLGDFNSNVTLTAGLLDSIHESCPSCKIIYISSAAVYGNPARLPIRETDPVSPISPYGYNKYLGEQLVEEYSRIFNLPGCCVRLFSAYGSGLRRQILWDVCQKITRQPEVRLMGTGSESRDMIHGKDIARAIALVALKAPFRGEIYNLASGVQVTVREIAEELIRIFDVEVPLIFTGERRVGDPLYWQADVARIAGLGFKTSIGIKDGLKEYAEWYMEHEQ